MYNIFHRPDVAMLFVVIKDCLHLKQVLFFTYIDLEGAENSLSDNGSEFKNSQFSEVAA